jgi:steroid delta-isomerase-like uncharacterized protein
MTSSKNNKVVMNRIFNEIFNKGNLKLADELLADDWVYHGAEGMELKGRDGFKQFVTMYRTAFPDLRISVDDMVCEGDKVVSIGNFQGTFKGPLMGIPPTGKQCSGKIMAVSRFKGGKEAEVLEIFDRLAMFQQLGVIPPMGPGKK